MTPQEKWERLNNPTCIEDYGLSISEEELVTFPAGAAILEALDEPRLKEKFDNLLGSPGANCGKTVQKIISAAGEHQQLINQLRMCRADLCEAEIIKQVQTVAGDELFTTTSQLRWCIDLAMKGEPMPWEEAPDDQPIP